VVNAMFWTSVCAWILEGAGWIPDLPSGITAMLLLSFGGDFEVMGTVERVADPRQEALPRELPTRLLLVSVHGRPLTVQLLRPR
jgi:hypothetical protein